jgi:hypothetical protein
MQPFELDAFRSITGMLMGRLAVDKHFILCDQLKRCIIDELTPIADIDSFPDEVLARASSAVRGGLHILHLPFKKASPPPPQQILQRLRYVNIHKHIVLLTVSSCFCNTSCATLSDR